LDTSTKNLRHVLKVHKSFKFILTPLVEVHMASLETEQIRCIIDSKMIPVSILHVDDDPGFLKVARAILCSDENYRIEGATSVAEAKKKLAIQHFDVIISDYEMPQKDGLQFLKELKEQKNQTPFILFTGKGREEVAIKALNLGAAGYVNKQGDTETVYGELRHCIKRAVTTKRAIIALQESEEKLKRIFDMSLVGITVFNLERNCYTDCNAAFERMLGYSREDIFGKNPIDLGLYKHPRDREEIVRTLLNEGLIEKKHVEFVAKSGDTKLAEVSIAIVEINGEVNYVSNILDLTDKHCAESIAAVHV